jgi:hypothetical protein
VTAVVDIDDDAVSMVRALAREHEPDHTVVLMTVSIDRPCIGEAANYGSPVLRAGFDRWGSRRDTGSGGMVSTSTCYLMTRRRI